MLTLLVAVARLTNSLMEGTMSRLPIRLSCLFVALIIATARGGPPASRLYVKTLPPGARVVLDGEALGVADGLFIVLPGDHTVILELEGYEPAKHAVQVAPERITRLVLTLVKAVGAEAAKPQRGEGFEAAVAMLGKAELPQALGGAMLTAVRQHPGESRWAGRSEGVLFGIAAKKLPGGAIRQRATPALLELTHSLAVQEMLKAKTLLDRYAAAGLDDATVLRQAVSRAAGGLQITGEATGLTHRASVQDDYATAYAFAEAGKLTAQLLQPVELEKVRAAYREVMHAQARDLMQRKNWADALALWGHLHTRKLISQALYLDAATCFVELEQAGDALKILVEAFDAYAAEASADWLEQCGDLACKLGDAGEPLAIKAYKQASTRLRNTLSTTPKAN